MNAFNAMALHIEVARHKRELAQAFAALRAELVPPPPEPTAAQRYAQNAQNAWNQAWLDRMAGMQAMAPSPYGGLAAQAANAGWPVLGNLYPYP